MLEGLQTEIQEEIAFQIIVALRDSVSLAKKATVTYEQAIRLLHDIDSKLYEEIIVIIGIKNVTDLAKYYQEQAVLMNLSEGKSSTPESLIDTEIARINHALNNQDVKNTLTPDELKHTRKRLFQLIAAKDSLSTQRRITEHTVLARDFSSVDRADLGATYFQSEDRFVDYKLNDGTYLRIRLLHPDKPEHITGADMIYEQHNEERRQIRFVFLQYKMWENGALSIHESSREEKQLLRLKGLLCDNGFCKSPADDSPELDYRFPHCCCFLRPTDRIQPRNNKLISTGIHIPVCNALTILKRERGSIDKKYIRHQSLTQEIFEHLFNKSFIGSKWLSEGEVSDLYLNSTIITPTESVIIYAREVYVPNVP